MSDRLSRARIRQLLVDCEPELRECFDVVSAMVHGGKSKRTAALLLGFQPKLLKVIQKLEGGYRDIKREEKRLIARKANYKVTWFKRRMAALSSYAKAITEVLAIARAIGDGFAWIWYERDPKLIDQHLKQQRQPFLPPGVGGLGEQLTLERLQGFDQKLLLYHGLTSFLRLGDVSFIDLKSARVAYIAEIKTKRESEQTVVAELSFVAERGTPPPKVPISEIAWPPSPRLPQSLRARRERQLKAIGDAVVAAATKSNADKHLGLDGQFHFDELDEVVALAGRRDFQFVQAGPSLILGAVHLSQTGSLADALLGSGNVSKRIGAKAPAWAMKILTDDPDSNSLALGFLATPENLPLSATGMPFVCWPAKPETLRRILFREVIVLTMYNSAHFWLGLKARGFELLRDGKGRFEGARKAAGKRTMELGNFRYFESLTPYGLVKVETVLGMVDQTLAAIRDLAQDGPVQLEIRPQITRRRTKSRSP